MQFAKNKLKLSKPSTEWKLERIVNAYKEQCENPFIVKLTKIAYIIPLTNALPERGASAIKRIKSRTKLNEQLFALVFLCIERNQIH